MRRESFIDQETSLNYIGGQGNSGNVPIIEEASVMGSIIILFSDGLFKILSGTGGRQPRK